MRALGEIGPHLNLELTLRRYHAHGPDAANWYDGRVFKKVFAAAGGLHLLSLQAQNGAAVLRVHPRTRRREVWQEAGRIARRVLGLDFPLPAFYAFAGSDPVLRQLVSRFAGLRPTLAADPFELLVTSISAQQINLRFAFAVRSRLVRRYGEPLQWQDERYFAFPTPARLARAQPRALRALQFTTKKASYLISLARAIDRGELDLEALPSLSDEEIAARLLPLRGIGPWTVDWFLARGLGRGHVLAAGDLGVRKALQHFYFRGRTKSEHELRRFASRWGEFTNLAVHYLLTGLALGT